MTRAMTSMLLTVLFCLLAGCSGMVGEYSCDLQLIEGKTEQADLSLAEARKSYFNQGPETISLFANGTYRREVSGSKHAGDWWQEDGKIMIRCRSQRGQQIAKGLISKGADTKFSIRDDGFYRRYGGKSSSYEVVFKKN